MSGKLGAGAGGGGRCRGWGEMSKRRLKEQGSWMGGGMEPRSIGASEGRWRTEPGEEQVGVLLL